MWWRGREGEAGGEKGKAREGRVTKERRKEEKGKRVTWWVDGELVMEAPKIREMKGGELEVKAKYG